jgi:signal transduction histidine kinase
MLLISLYLVLAVVWWTWSLIAYGVRTVELEKAWLQRDYQHIETRLSLDLISHRYPGQDSVNWNGGTYRCDLPALFDDINQNEHHLQINLDSKKQLSITGLDEQLSAIDVRLHKNKNKWLGEGLTLGALLLVILGLMWSNLNRILKLNQQQTNFLLAVTHELKTPIAAAKLAIETALRKPDPALFERMLTLSKQNMNRLAKTMDKVLLATRLDTNIAQPSKEWIPIKELIEESLNQAQVAPELMPHIHLELSSDLQILADKSMLATALQNLISNSIKYSEENCVNINISTQVGNDRCTIWVKDNGIGIEGTEKKMVVKKFYRVGDEHTRARQGTGLGLYLVNQIAKMHSAQLIIEDNTPSGTSIGITFKQQDFQME